MKKLLISTLVSVLLSNVSFGQHYAPFPNDSIVWYTVFTQQEMLPPYYSYYTDKYEVIGDTVLNLKTYQKIYRSAPDSLNSSATYIGAYRTEPDSLLVYYIDKWDISEILIYNFNLNPNDSILIRGVLFICIDTSSVILSNGLSHKVQNMLVPDASNCQQTWISGIGSLGIPFKEPYWGCSYTFELSYNTTCFYHNDTLIYEWDTNPYFTGCIGQYLINIDELEPIVPKIVPNPVINESKVVGSYDKNLNYQIIDVYGRIIYERFDISFFDIRIRVEDLPSGVYFMQLHSDDYSYKQLIKFQVN